MKKVLPKVKRIINMSLKQVKFYGDNEVRIEHIIISLINDYNNNAIKTLVKMGVDVDRLHKQIEKIIIVEKDDYQNVKINSKELSIDSVVENVLKGAEKECENLNDDYLDTQHIVLSLLKIKNNISNLLKSMKINYKEYRNNIVNSTEPVDSDGENNFKKPKPKSGNKNNETPILDNFSIDVTKRASEGKIDPVIGRDESIQRVAQILARKKKNNPVIIGDPGCVLGDTKIKVKKISDISIHNFIEK